MTEPKAMPEPTRLEKAIKILIAITILLLIVMFAIQGFDAFKPPAPPPEDLPDVEQVDETDLEALPLDAALERLRTAKAKIDAVEAYSATFIKREREDNELSDFDTIRVIVRHRPFSFYLRLMAPPSKAGREVIFVEGENEGKLVLHGTGLQRVLGTQRLDPNGSLAKRLSKNPITQIGLSNLTSAILEDFEESNGEDPTVRTEEGVTIGERECDLIEFNWPEPIDDENTIRKRLFIDRETGFVIRYEKYGISEADDTPGAPLELIAEYHYTDIDTDVEITANTFDPNNDGYDFP